MIFKLPLFTAGALSFLIAVLSSSAQGQNNKPTEKSKPVFVGFNFSTDYSYRTLKNDGNDQSTNLVIVSRNDYEIAKFGYTTGLNVFFHCSERVGFETGIQYANKGYKTTNKKLIFEAPDTGLPAKFRLRYSYHYIGIPLKARFTSGSGQVRFVSSLGVVTSILSQVKQTSWLEFANGTTQKKKQTTAASFNKIDISAVISIGFRYLLDDKFYFMVEPTFRYGVVQTMDAPVREHLWSAGINVGMYRKLCD